MKLFLKKIPKLNNKKIKYFNIKLKINYLMRIYNLMLKK